MTEYRDWSITASANTGNAVNGYFKENMAYSEVNDAARELQAIMARHRLDNSGVIVTTGSTGSYVATINATLTSYADGDTVVFQPHVKNDGASTMRLKFIDDTSLSDRPMVNTALAALSDGDLVANSTYLAHYNSASENFRVVNVPGGVGNLSTISTSGDVSVGGSLAVKGNTSLSGALAVGGDASISGLLSAKSGFSLLGGANLNGNADIHGDVSISGNTNMVGTLDVHGAVSVSGAVAIQGGLTLASPGLDVAGNGNFHDNVSISGTLAVTGASDVQDLDAHGDVSISGSLTVASLPVIGSILTIKTADESVTSSTTFQEDDHLTDIVLEGLVTYALDSLLMFDAAGDGPGLKFKYILTNTVSNESAVQAIGADGGGTVVGDATFGSLSQFTIADFTTFDDSLSPTIKVSGIITPHASGTTLKMFWAQAVSSGTAMTLYAGSYLRLTPLN